MTDKIMSMPFSKQGRKNYNKIFNRKVYCIVCGWQGTNREVTIAAGGIEVCPECSSCCAIREIMEVDNG